MSASLESQGPLKLDRSHGVWPPVGMDFVVIDVETANPNMASVCQIGVVVFEGGREVAAEGCLVDPCDYFDPYHVGIHGIEDRHVRGRPSFAGSYAWLAGYTAGRVVVSHTAFDRTALSQACSRYELDPLPARWLDSASVARRAWPAFAQKGYGLKSLANAFDISFRHHDAVEDARAAGLILCRALDESGVTLDDWFGRCRQPLNGMPRSVRRTGDGDGPLVGEVVVITGALSLPRQKVADLIHDAGGAVEPGVNKTTSLLVVGDQDVSRLAGKTKSSKHMKAEQLIAAGQPIRILTESDFGRLIQAE